MPPVGSGGRGEGCREQNASWGQGRGAVSRMPPGGRGGTEARVEEGWQAGVTLL